MKKIIVGILVLAVLIAAGVNVISHKAPEILRHSLERSLGKTVKIREIKFRFPWNFELSGVEVRDKDGIFSGEICFAVDKIHLSVSPLSLSQKELVIDRFDVEDATLTIRKRGGRLYHVLSNAMIVRPATSDNPATTTVQAREGRLPASLPLTIHQFHLTNGKFQWIDYDVSAEGFVTTLDQIRALVKEIDLPAKDNQTFYHVEARLPQGRDQKPASAQMNGWTVFSSLDTDTLMNVEGLQIPYFEPYLRLVTPAYVEDGVLDSRVSLQIDHKELTGNADLEARSLSFRSYEGSDQLFGLKADEILSFLKDASGRLKFQIVVQWNLADKTVKKRDVIRRSIERSLKKTVLGNIGNLLENTLKKISDHGLDSKGDDWEGALKKVKGLFR